MPAPITELGLTELIGQAIKNAQVRGLKKEYDWAIAVQGALAQAGYRFARMTPAEYARRAKEWDRSEREAEFRRMERDRSRSR
jgi:uncharacterized protein YdaT